MIRFGDYLCVVVSGLRLDPSFMFLRQSQPVLIFEFWPKPADHTVHVGFSKRLKRHQYRLLVGAPRQYFEANARP